VQANYFQLSDYIAQVRVLIHDPSASDYTDAQLTTMINTARVRAATDLRCVRQFITGLNTITQQESYPLTGFCGGIVVQNGGTGYAVTDTVTLAGGGGSGATASLVVSGGVIQAVNMTNWGGAYATRPALTIHTTTGSGAVLVPIVGANILDIMMMTVLWNGPPSSLAVTFSWLPFNVFQAFCRAYRGAFSNPGAWAAHYGPVSPLSPQADARAFYMYPIPNQAYPLEMDVLTTPSALALAADVDYQLINPWNDAVQYFAANLAFLGLQNYAAADAMENRYQRRCRELPATGFARRVHSFYRSFARMVGRI
jgi:hypothetical protein